MPFVEVLHISKLASQRHDARPSLQHENWLSVVPRAGNDFSPGFRADELNRNFGKRIVVEPTF
eukprot:6042610-Heterocapsa_arctica.AAC.1